jgi:hypothetical protein
MNLNETLSDIREFINKNNMTVITPNTMIVPRGIVGFLYERGYKTEQDVMELIETTTINLGAVSSGYSI